MQVNQEPKKSVTDYLAALAWDGTPRLDRWLIDCAGAEDTPHVRAMSRAMLVAAVRRARHPGCRFVQMPVLTGPQGCGKSSALRMLAVEDAWFTDQVPIGSEDVRQIIEATQGKWIVEACELERLFRVIHDIHDENDENDEKDQAWLKSFLARSSEALPYQREHTRVPRQFVVFGTTGADTYLQGTGDRRFWPVVVRRFDLTLLVKIRDQLWAEAGIAEAAGESIDLASLATTA